MVDQNRQILKLVVSDTNKRNQVSPTLNALHSRDAEAECCLNCARYFNIIHSNTVNHFVQINLNGFTHTRGGSRVIDIFLFLGC